MNNTYSREGYNPVNEVHTVERYLRNTGSVWLKDSDVKDKVDLHQPNLLHYKGFTTIDKVGDMESRVAENIMRLKWLNTRLDVSDAIINSYIEEFEQTENEGRQLHYKQKDGVRMAVRESICVLTGGPGTGKTTVLSCMVYVLRKLQSDNRVVFTAPTGKAANRIKESTGENATTTHKKLGLGRGNKPETFWEDTFIMDESSMADLVLADALFKAIPLGKKLILVGDEEQLPSVGIGAVLRDIIASGVIECTMLTKTFRQDDSSTLFQNIKNIKEGLVELVEGSDFHPIELSQEISLNDIAITLRNNYIEMVEKYGIDDVCLLVPYRQSRQTISSDVMSPFIQKAVNKNTVGYKSRKFFFSKDDRVMQLENRTECANGDIGIVLEANETGVIVDFFGTQVHYETAEELETLALAYSMTIHKSQGSEYKAVIMCLLDSHEKMLNRNLIYTGVTRAKKECFLYYQPKALEKAIKTKADENRYSFLVEKLRALDIEYRLAQYNIA